MVIGTAQQVTIPTRTQATIVHAITAGRDLPQGGDLNL
jgi:hypothetical protein